MTQQESTKTNRLSRKDDGTSDLNAPDYEEARRMNARNKA